MKPEQRKAAIRRIRARLTAVPEGDAATEALLDAVKAIVDLMESEQ